MGAVWRARDASGQEAALKLLLVGAGASAVQRSRFRREAEALARARHAGIVAVLDAGESEGVPFLAMELLAGRTLADALESGPLALDGAVGLATALARALAHAHAQGILHRDLKPANVMLTARGPVLTDFGLTRDLEPSLTGTVLSVPGRSMGTPGYWPPEQAKGEVDAIGPQSDVYGLGAILVAALTGEPPHGEPENLAQALAQAEREPPSPSSRRAEIDARLDAICARALACDPEARYPSMAALAEDLARWSAGLEPAQRAALRRGSLASPLVFAGALALLGVIASLAILLLRARDPEPARPRPGAASASSASPAIPLIQRALSRLDSDPQAALGELDRALELEPGEARAWLLRGTVRERLLDRQGALTDYERAIALDPQNARAHSARASVLEHLGDHAAALKAIDIAIALDGHSVFDLTVRSSLRMRANDLAGALADCERAIALEPRDASGWSCRGDVHLAMGDPPRALADFDRAIALHRGFAAAHCGRAQAHTALGDVASALADYQRAAALDPLSAEALAGVGGAKLGLGDLAGAIAELERARDLAPDRVPTLGNLAIALAQRKRPGDLERAKQLLERIAELTPLDPDTHENLAGVKAELGDKAGAIATYRRALELLPPEDRERAAFIGRLIARLER